jgi:thiamine kinase-like enzyme
MLTDIVKQFFPYHAVAELKPFGNGHINDTYKLDLDGVKEQYILQRINTYVFKDPQGIAETHLKIQEVVSKRDYPITIAELLPTADGRLIHFDEDGNAWRLTSFIPDSYNVEVVEEAWQAFEAGTGFGWFVKACDGLEATEFKESIKDFHRLSFRIWQLDEAIKGDKAGRLASVHDIVDFFKSRQHSLSLIETMVDEGKIPLRVVHNDTKINNLLFRGKKAAAVIDLDTVGPGIIYYDYGDALRTGASTAAEDEKDLSKVDFNMEAFQAYTMGYMGQVSPVVTQTEEKYFFLAPRLMTFIMGIRFLADYLNGDVYYKIAHKEHNIDRCKVQKKLIECMEAKEAEMKAVIKTALETLPENRVKIIGL